MIKSFLLVGLGGGLGSIVRYSIALLLTRLNVSYLVLSTFAANLIGCFIAGFAIGYIEKNIGYNHQIRLFLIIGFCGGLTTFSTFAVENINYINSRLFFSSILYVFSSILFGFLAVWAGLQIIRP